jgi:putative membrane protein
MDASKGETMKRMLLMMAASAAAALMIKRAFERRELALDAGTDTQALSAEEELWPIEQPADDTGVLGALVMLDEHQIAAAEIALNRPVPEEIQTLASTLREEHQSHLEETRELIDQLEMQLAQDEVVAEIESRCFARRSQLGETEDQWFEQAYVSEVVDDHERMLEFIDRALLPAANDVRVLQHVRRTREHIASHLAEARMLA